MSLSAPTPTPTLSDSELELRLLYCIIVAGKTAKFAERALREFMSTYAGTDGPFDTIRRLVAEGLLNRALVVARTGNYRRIGLAFRQLVAANVDLKTCAPSDLMSIHGIGPKTSRFFVIWTRPYERFAALDVHVLRWLKERGHQNIPDSTPTSPVVYARLEKIFLDEADKMGLTPRQLDAKIWGASNVGGIQ